MVLDRISSRAMRDGTSQLKQPQRVDNGPIWFLKRMQRFCDRMVGMCYTLPGTPCNHDPSNRATTRP